jgi:hypothetical protein
MEMAETGLGRAGQSRQHRDVGYPGIPRSLRGGFVGEIACIFSPPVSQTTPGAMDEVGIMSVNERNLEIKPVMGSNG